MSGFTSFRVEFSRRGHDERFWRHRKAWQVLLCPARHLLHDTEQVGSLYRQPVLVSRWAERVSAAINDAIVDQRRETICKDVGRNLFRHSKKLAVAPLADEQSAQNKQAPTIPDQIECARNGAV